MAGLQRIERSDVREPAARTAGMYPRRNTPVRQRSPLMPALDAALIGDALNAAGRGMANIADVMERIDAEADAVSIGKLEAAMNAEKDKGLADFNANAPNQELFESIPRRVEDFRTASARYLEELPLSGRGRERAQRALDLSCEQMRFLYESRHLHKRLEYAASERMDALKEAVRSGNPEAARRWIGELNRTGVRTAEPEAYYLSAAAKNLLLRQADSLNYGELDDNVRAAEKRLSDRKPDTFPVRFGEEDFAISRQDYADVVRALKVRRRELEGLGNDRLRTRHDQGERFSAAQLREMTERGEISEAVAASWTAQRRQEQFQSLAREMRDLVTRSALPESAAVDPDTARMNLRDVALRAEELRQSGDLADEQYDMLELAADTGDATVLEHAEKRRKANAKLLADAAKAGLYYQTEDAETLKRKINAATNLSAVEKSDICRELDRLEKEETNGILRNNPEYKTSMDYLKKRLPQMKYSGWFGGEYQTDAYAESRRAELAEMVRRQFLTHPDMTMAKLQPMIDQAVAAVRESRVASLYLRENLAITGAFSPEELAAHAVIRRLRQLHPVFDSREIRSRYSEYGRALEVNGALLPPGAILPSKEQADKMIDRYRKRGALDLADVEKRVHKADGRTVLVLKNGRELDMADYDIDDWKYIPAENRWERIYGSN